MWCLELRDKNPAERASMVHQSGDLQGEQKRRGRSKTWREGEREGEKEGGERQDENVSQTHSLMNSKEKASVI